MNRGLTVNEQLDSYAKGCVMAARREGRPDVISPELRELIVALVDAAVDRAERRLSSVRDQSPGNVRPLSLRSAARRLGVRYETLHVLIARGELRAVVIAGRCRVPLAEIERVEREGTSPSASFGGQRKTRPPSGAPVASDEVAKW